MRFKLILIMGTLVMALPISVVASHGYPHTAVDGGQPAVYVVGTVVELLCIGALLALEKLMTQREPVKPAAENK